MTAALAAATSELCGRLRQGDRNSTAMACGRAHLGFRAPADWADRDALNLHLRGVLDNSFFLTSRARAGRRRFQTAIF